MLKMLPPLPLLTHGQFLQLLTSDGTKHPSSSIGGSGSSSSKALLLLWHAALQCLRLLKADTLLELTAIADPSKGDASITAEQLTQCQMRCLLVIAGKLNWRESSAVRTLLIKMQPQATATSPTTLTQGVSQLAASTKTRGGRQDLPNVVPAFEALLMLMSLASSSAPQTAQLQMLMEVMDSVKLLANPVSAVYLLASLVATWYADSAPGAHKGHSAAAAPAGQLSHHVVIQHVIDTHVCTATAQSSLVTLPFTLPGLLRRRDWATSIDQVVVRMTEVAGGLTTGLSESMRRALGAAILAVRDDLQQSASLDLLYSSVLQHSV
eukprot:jgi/Chrzof1/2121/Cz11g03110.t1